MGGYWRSNEVKCQGSARHSREEGYSVLTHLSYIIVLYEIRNQDKPLIR